MFYVKINYGFKVYDALVFFSDIKITVFEQSFVMPNIVTFLFGTLLLL